MKDTIKKLIGDIELQNDQQTTLANDSAASLPIRILQGILGFFLDYQSHRGMQLSLMVYLTLNL